MNEELKIMKEETENYEATELVPAEYHDEPETTGNGIVGKIVVGVVAVGAGVGALVWHKNKAEREERAIRKLEKKGYVISKVQDAVVVEAKPEVDSESNEEVQEEK